MCKPSYIGSIDYIINPWMQPSLINPKKAMTQWENLVEILQGLGITVELIDPVEGLPDMMFTTNAAYVFGKKVLLGRFRYKERQGETAHYRKWFKEHGYEIIELPEEIYLEGNGTMAFWNDKLFVGVGYRTDRQAVGYLRKLFPKFEVVELYEAAPAFYHLNIGFFPLNDETIFYYPDAFREENQEKLKKIVPNLLSFSEKTMESFGANSIVTGDVVIHPKGVPTFKKKLENLGYTSIEVDLSEFKKSGGGAQCLINVLE